MTKRNKLGLAVTAALSIGVAAQSAQAANIAHGGVGELAFVPYYSTTNGKQTYVRLTNNSFDTIVVKLAVREGENSVDKRDFFIFLSPRDVWTGKIYSDGQNVVRIGTNDTSCTVPSKDRGWIKGQFGDLKDDKFKARLDFDDTVIPNDGWSVAIAKNSDGSFSEEGYIDIRVVGTSEASHPIQRLGEYSPIEFVQHEKRFLKNEAGIAITVPNDCHAVSAAFDLQQQGTSLQLRDQALFDFVRAQYTEPTNALSVVAAMIDPNGGKLTDMPVTVLANVTNPNGVDGVFTTYADGIDSNDVIDSIGKDGSVDLKTVVTPKLASIFNDFSGESVAYETANGQDAISAALMSSSISGYVDSTGSNSWIVNFPTKRLHKTGGTCSDPFPTSCVVSISNMVHSVTNGGNVTTITNEEESQFATQHDNTICFSGTDFEENCKAEAEGNSVNLPTEVNVVTLSTGGTANPLGSKKLAVKVNSTSLNADNLIGWMQMKFTNAPGMNVADAARNPVHLNGLPVIGFSYKEYGPASVMTQNYTYSSSLPR